MECRQHFTSTTASYSTPQGSEGYALPQPQFLPHRTCRSSTTSIIRMRTRRGLSFFFIPINTIAYLGVAKGENNDVSGLINLARNIGAPSGQLL